MAEIRIERKEKRSWLPLVLGALVLLAVLAYVFMRPQTVAPAMAGTDSTRVPAASLDTTRPAAGATGVAPVGSAPTGSGTAGSATAGSATAGTAPASGVAGSTGAVPTP